MEVGGGRDNLSRLNNIQKLGGRKSIKHKVIQVVVLIEAKVEY